ncbi:hypothetical protein OPIT5_04425 [Opitutaceae bacterium TAV5]|nr:hypothetical protein OPIT5_04425 [Opitutaceae bacterium TAV5]
MTEAVRQSWLHVIVNTWDRAFDPGSGWLCLPGNSRRIREHAGDGKEVESLYYALALLELADRPRQGRAEAIMARVMAWQKTTAIPQAARDLGMGLWLIRFRHRTRLPAELRQQLEEACLDAAHLAARTDATAASVFVQLAAAEPGHDDTGMRGLLEDLMRMVSTASPQETASLLVALHAIESNVRHPLVREQIGPLVVSAWREAARRFGRSGKDRPDAVTTALAMRATQGLAGGAIVPEADQLRALLCVLAINLRLPDAFPETLAALWASGPGPVRKSPVAGLEVGAF